MAGDEYQSGNIICWGSLSGVSAAIDFAHCRHHFYSGLQNGKEIMKRSIEDTPIVFIGAGNLATNLAKALYHKGFRIVQVYSRTMESARTLAEKVEAEYTTDLQEVSKDAKLYIVSLKDAALVDLLPQITEGKQNSLLVHTAGSIPMSIWEGHAERYGVFLSDADIQQTT